MFVVDGVDIQRFIGGVNPFGSRFRGIEFLLLLFVEVIAIAGRKAYIKAQQAYHKWFFHLASFFNDEMQTTMVVPATMCQRKPMVYTVRKITLFLNWKNLPQK
jgi:hypothetical protein